MALHVEGSLRTADIPAPVVTLAAGSTAELCVARKRYLLEHGAPLVLHSTYMAQSTAPVDSGSGNRKLLLAEQKPLCIMFELQRRSGRHDRTLVDIAERLIVRSKQITLRYLNLTFISLQRTVYDKSAASGLDQIVA